MTSKPLTNNNSSSLLKPSQTNNSNLVLNRKLTRPHLRSSRLLKTLILLNKRLSSNNSSKCSSRLINQTTNSNNKLLHRICTLSMASLLNNTRSSRFRSKSRNNKSRLRFNSNMLGSLRTSSRCHSRSNKNQTLLVNKSK